MGISKGANKRRQQTMVVVRPDAAADGRDPFALPWLKASVADAAKHKQHLAELAAQQQLQSLQQDKAGSGGGGGVSKTIAEQFERRKTMNAGADADAGGEPKVLTVKEVHRRMYLTVPTRRQTEVNNKRNHHHVVKFQGGEADSSLLDQLHSYYIPEGMDEDDEARTDDGLYTDANLMKREAIKFDPRIQQVLNQIWDCTDANHDGQIQKSETTHRKWTILKRLATSKGQTSRTTF